MIDTPQKGRPAASAPKARAAPPPKPGAPVFDKKPAPLPEEDANDGAQEKAEPKKFWRSWKAMLAIAGAVIVVAAAGIESWIYLRRAAPPAQPEVYDRARDPNILSGGAQAVDGATITLAGQTIVLQGIRAPRANAMCGIAGREFRCGETARLELQKLIGTAGVECVRAGALPGGAVIALCRTDDGIDLAAAQVEAGWAVTDISRSSHYVPEQRRAEDSNSGLWRDDLARPEAWK